MVLIGLGSNRGDSRSTIASAMRRLAEYAVGELRCSDLWRTSPVDCPPGSGDFINAAAAFQARDGLSPEALLGALKALEVEYGRGPTPVRNAPRELDLDLLLFDDQTRDEPDFTLPHPRAVNRLFVLAPAAQVAADVVWPGTGTTVSDLLAQLQTDEQVEVLDAMPVD
ncbi:MAG: 2-amino-4-hydroxy-6-hydroxymethyldihydropteridine diphosphokinase [Pseudomonadales bacterium]|jgi:2-amino-4-hydroxy-6-hydroxymethyldihydropteridine diphosphokinase